MPLEIMRDEDTGAVPVVDNGRAVGMVTDRDIVVRAVADGSTPNRPVREIVTSAVVTVTPDMSTREAAQLMSEHQIRRLPVVENERLVGIVSLGDIAVKEGKDSPLRRHAAGDLGRREGTRTRLAEPQMTWRCPSSVAGLPHSTATPPRTVRAAGTPPFVAKRALG